jgi:hypothetical protein
VHRVVAAHGVSPACLEELCMLNYDNVEKVVAALEARFNK